MAKLGYVRPNCMSSSAPCVIPSLGCGQRAFPASSSFSSTGSRMAGTNHSDKLFCTLVVNSAHLAILMDTTRYSL